MSNEFRKVDPMIGGNVGQRYAKRRSSKKAMRRETVSSAALRYELRQIDVFDREIISWAAVADAGILGSDISQK
jgi:hypothetical protein